eukprot:6185659-Pyramimonas_sp.AAC.1
MDFVVFAPRRSNAWQMAAIQSIGSMQHLYATQHQVCAWDWDVCPPVSSVPLRLCVQMVSTKDCPVPHVFVELARHVA